MFVFESESTGVACVFENFHAACNVEVAVTDHGITYPVAVSGPEPVHARRDGGVGFVEIILDVDVADLADEFAEEGDRAFVDEEDVSDVAADADVVRTFFDLAVKAAESVDAVGVKTLIFIQAGDTERRGVFCDPCGGVRDVFEGFVEGWGVFGQFQPWDEGMVEERRAEFGGDFRLVFQGFLRFGTAVDAGSDGIARDGQPMFAENSA